MKKETGPIIQSLLDVDFYKFTMMQFIFCFFKDVIVRFTFKNRTKGVALAHVIPIEELRRELDHIRTLRFAPDEIEYLKEKVPTPLASALAFLRAQFIAFLVDLRLPEYELEYVGDEIKLSFVGAWPTVMLWETLALSVINELYYRQTFKKLADSEIEAVYREGRERLERKILTLQANPQILFNEFGTRRRFSFAWQGHVIERFAETLPTTQLLGTSSVYYAKKLGLTPKGTNAHELQMVIAGLWSQNDERLRGSQGHMLMLWEMMYGPSIFLPDTFGTESFLKLLDPEMGKRWKGFRQDSDDPIVEGKRYLAFYEKHAVDAREKVMVPSDGLEIPIMLDIEKHFRDKIRTEFGWGTNATNDLGFKPLSMVVKATEANGISLVKLSNNPAKAMGRPKDIEWYMQVFGFDLAHHVAVKTVY
jgi:nicotinate phosphoribosyltransferase